MISLALSLLGPPRLTSGDEIIKIRARKAVALLTYLAVTGQPHSRDALATLLWPESDQTKARGNLRRTLHRLQQSLPADILRVEADTLDLSDEVPLWVDIHAYREIIERCLPDLGQDDPIDPACFAQLVEADSLYTDDFMAGFTLEDAPPFDEWQFFQRESLRGLQVRLLHRLERHVTAAGDFGAAIDLARRQLVFDALDEAVHRRLMTHYYYAGQHAAALRQFHECQRILDVELGVPPEDETVELHQAIAAKELPSPAILAPPVAQPADAAAVAFETPTVPRGRRRQQTGPFVGREDEVSHILGLLREEPTCRFVVLTGPSGVGKSRLAHHVAHQIGTDADNPSFADGILFVDLSATSGEADLIMALAAACGVRPSNNLDLKDQVLASLLNKNMLVLLDQLEMVQGGTEVIGEILEATPRIKVLATSLEGVQHQRAWIVSIGALRYPMIASDEMAPGDMSLDDMTPGDAAKLRAYASVRLFEEHARRVRANFSLESEAVYVAQICRLVEGLPLAIELAASWLTALSPRDIAVELEQGLHTLTARDAGMPPRHRSMAAVLDTTWAMLDTHERKLFARLAIFEGGFTAIAARSIVGADVHQLALLVDKSVLQLDSRGRYFTPKLFRQFALDQLAADEPELQRVRDLHAEYFMHKACINSDRIRSPRQQEALLEIGEEFGNITQAWATFVVQARYDELFQATTALWLYAHYQGKLIEVGDTLRRTVAELRQTVHEASDDEHGRNTLLSLLTMGIGWLAARRGNASVGRGQVEAGLAQLYACGLRGTGTDAFCLAYLGMTAQYESHYQESRTLARQSVDLFRQLGDDWGVAMALEVLGTAVLGCGLLEEARAILRASLTAATGVEDKRLEQLCLMYLGAITARQGAYEEANELLLEAQTLGRAVGDNLAMATAKVQLGYVAMCRGHYEEAEEHLLTSMRMQREASITTYRRVKEFLAATYRALSRTDEAEQLAWEALQASNADQNSQHLVESLEIVTMLAADRKEYYQAEKYVRQAQSILAQEPYPPSAATAANQMGEICLATQRIASAEEHFRQALAISRLHMLAPTALSAMTGMTQLLVQRGDQAYARRVLAFVLQHPATTHEVCLRAQTLYEALHGEAISADGPRWHWTDWLALSEEIEKRFDELSRQTVDSLARNFPTPSSPFVGREQELTNMMEILARPACRLITVIGLGGIGKTRLVLEIAQRLADANETADDATWYADGITFVPVSTVMDRAELTGEIAKALGLETANTQNLGQKLLDSLGLQSALLILDGFEHLMEEGAFISAMLAAAPHLKIVVTSRIALNLPDAWFYPVGGMSYPRPDERRDALSGYESIQLFEQCAQRIRPDFDGAGSIEAVAHICRLLEGMPLAIELVATWLRLLPPDAIVREIIRGTDILTARYGEMASRHRSMRAVLEQSWALLTDSEQQAFMALAIFRGGFRLPAAEAVADVSLSVLIALVEKSLLTLSESGRYSMHEIVRQYAAEKLAVQPDARERVESRFVKYYVDFLGLHHADIIGAHQKAALEKIGDEIDNIRVFWQWALEHDDIASLERALTPYKYYLWVRDRGQSGEEVFHHALRAIHQSAQAHKHPRYATFHQLLLHELAAFNYFLGNLDMALKYAQQAVGEARRLGDKHAIATELSILGTIQLWLGQSDDARENLEAGLQLRRELGAIDGMSDTLHELAQYSIYTGDFQTARTQAEESLFYGHQIARSDYIGYAALTVGTADFYLGNFTRARRSFDEALSTFSGIGHLLGMVYGWEAIGRCYWAEDEPDMEQAEHYARRGLDTARRIDHRLQMANCLADLAQYANDRGAHDLAEQYAREGVEIAEAIQCLIYVSRNLCCLAEAAYRTHQFTQAHRLLARALRVAADAHATPYVLLAVYHTGEMMLHEARSTSLPDQDEDGRMTDGVQFLQLYRKHPAAWEVERRRATHRLAALGIDMAGDSAAESPVDNAELTQYLDQVARRLAV